MVALRGDTGFRPLYIDILSRCLKYLEVLENELSGSLLGIALSIEIELYKDGYNGWYAGIVAARKELTRGGETVSGQGAIWKN